MVKICHILRSTQILQKPLFCISEDHKTTSITDQEVINLKLTRLVNSMPKVSNTFKLFPHCLKFAGHDFCLRFN